MTSHDWPEHWPHPLCKAARIRAHQLCNSSSECGPLAQRALRDWLLRQQVERGLSNAALEEVCAQAPASVLFTELARVLTTP